MFVLLLKIMALFLMGGDSIPWSIWHLYLRSCSVFGLYKMTSLFALFFGICNFWVFYIIFILGSVSSEFRWCLHRCWDWCVKLAKGHIFVCCLYLHLYLYLCLYCCSSFCGELTREGALYWVQNAVHDWSLSFVWQHKL